MRIQRDGKIYHVLEPGDEWSPENGGVTADGEPITVPCVDPVRAAAWLEAGEAEDARRSELEALTVAELRERVAELEIETNARRKDELVDAILTAEGAAQRDADGDEQE